MYTDKYIMYIYIIYICTYIYMHVYKHILFFVTNHTNFRNTFL